MAGQVGAQVKIRVGNIWLVASIRDQQMHERGEGLIVATIDFLGEGDEEKITGRIHNFRRGVTRYPIPGGQVYAATSADLKQIYAADERAHVELGTVYPTKDIRGRSEEHTSELQSLMRTSYSVFCLQKKKDCITTTTLEIKQTDPINITA